MANIWTVKTNHELGVYAERVSTTIALPLNTTNFTISSVTLISGSLPAGLRIDGTNLIGTPFEVERTTQSRFVLRAKTSTGTIADCTLSAIVEGPDSPTWVTPTGMLAPANPLQYFILDNTPVDFQLDAIDADLPAGDTLEYFIADGGGTLPPGIQLTTDGRLVGVVEPILALDKFANSGRYDTNVYGTFPFDFGIRSASGFDSFFYDTRIYDDNIPTKSPRKLNRYYEFTVSVSDGDTIATRDFKIYLVGDDYLRADNTIMQVANGLFTADNTYIRTPIWLTPGNLGYKRANNFLTVYLDTLDPSNVAGVISYSLRSLNDDNSTSTLPPGLTLDTSTGEIAGRVPYQPAVTKTYKFTIRANRLDAQSTIESYKDKTFTLNLLGEIESTITWTTAADLGSINANLISTFFVNATTNVPNGKLVYTLASGKLPPGLNLSLSGEIIGKVRQFGDGTLKGLTTFDKSATETTFDNNGTTIDKVYKFTVNAQDRFKFSQTTREFKITILDPDDNLYSNLYVKPFIKETTRSVFNTFVSDPNIFVPEYVYRSGDPEFGVQKDLKMLAYAGIITKDVKNYVAAAAKHHKRRTYTLGQVKTAKAVRPGTNTTIYEVVYVEVIDPAMPTKGNILPTINVGKARKLTVDSVGFEAKDDNSNLGSGESIITFTGQGQTAIQVTSNGTNLEVVTRSGVVVIPTAGTVKVTLSNGTTVSSDQQFITNLADPYRFRPKNSNTVKVSDGNVKISETNNPRKHVVNTQTMRNQIATLGLTERDFLPLWMRSAQEASVQELGYVTALPLCYTKPGYSDDILLRIQNSNFNFKQINFDIDRYIIDSTTGNSNEQYILFPNYEYNV
tara:strand:- start:1527 stop:4070 length:2544 start_codon:yes stop_codon:yes gene_type:complete